MDDELMIAAFKDIVIELCEANILSDYGHDGLAAFKVVSDRLKTIHQNIDYKTKKKLIVIKSISSNEILPEMSSTFEEFSDPSRLTVYTSSILVIEILGNGRYYLDNIIPDIDKIKHDSIVYKWESNNESFVGKTFIKNLPVLPGSHSCFAIKTFKTLEDALEHYKINYALNASCKLLSGGFENINRLYFLPAPEETLRDSLYLFLKARIRENVAVEREQNMDASHPVDIKVTWNYSTHIAIIEVKWIGSSYDKNTAKFVDYFPGRANAGAKQLAEYLEMINTSVTNKITRGYLVVFDIRRRKVKPYKTTISKSDGLHFENTSIVYNPAYHQQRTDFEKPQRFFIKPYSLL